MNRVAFTMALIATTVGSVGCKGSAQTETATGSSAGAEASRVESSLESQSDDEDLFVSPAAGFALRKPSSWHFMPTAWRSESLKNVDFKDDDFAELMETYATEPLVMVVKHEETKETLNPTLQVVFRPLGQLERMSPEDVAKLSLEAMPQMYEDFEVVEDVESTEVGGHPAAHYATRFTLRNDAGATFPTLSDAWIVKRGAYLFMIGGSGPPDGEDASRPELEAMVRSIVIEPLPP